MSESTAVDLGREGHPLATAVKVLLMCAIVGPLVYSVADVHAVARWDGYSYIRETFNELAVIGMRIRSVWRGMGVVRNPLSIALRLGVISYSSVLCVAALALALLRAEDVKGLLAARGGKCNEEGHSYRRQPSCRRRHVFGDAQAPGGTRIIR